MTASPPPRSKRLYGPWRVVDASSECFLIEDAGGVQVAHVYFEDDEVRRGLLHRLTSAEARKVADSIARIPELLQAERGQPATDT